MSYIKKGLRQSLKKNVIDRGFQTKEKFFKNHIDTLTDYEKRMELKHLSDRKQLRSNWLNFGTLHRNSSITNTDHSRNWNNCLDGYGRFIKIESQKRHMEENWKNFKLIEYGKHHNTEIFQKYGTKDRLFHLTSPKNWKMIKQYGLISRLKNHNFNRRKGNIYFVQSDHNKVWNQIGFGQITSGIDNQPVVVLEIDMKGITGNLFGEDGNEFCTPFHTVLTDQKRILPQFIKYQKTFHTNELNFYEFRTEMGEGKRKIISEENNVSPEQVKIMGVDSNVNKEHKFEPKIKLDRVTKKKKREYRLVS